MSSRYKCLIIFITFFLLFLFIHLSVDGFAGFDPYYHAKHAALMGETHNINLVEPWIEFHFFKSTPNNPWWGYQLILSIFVSIFGLFLGTKILVSILAGCIFSFFYFFISELKIKYPLVWTFLFLSVPCMLQNRLLLERPFLVGIIFLPLGLWLMIKKKYIWLFVLSVVFALAYNLSPLIIVMACIFLLAELLTYRHLGKIDLKVLIASGGGILVGVILHPNTLNYVYIIYVHLVEVFVVKLKGVDAAMSMEVNLTLGDKISNNAIIFAIALIALGIFILTHKYRKNSAEKFTANLFALLNLIWGVLTLFVFRGIDYWPFFMWIFTALMFDQLRKKINPSVYDLSQQKILRLFSKSVLVVIMFTLTFQFFYNTQKTILKINFRNVDDIDYYSANQWLMDNSSQGEIVFCHPWSMFPKMFFYNHKNHYVTGISPIFLYTYNQKLFSQWVDIIHSKDQLTPVSDMIRTSFKTKYIAVDNKYKTDFYYKLAADDNFQQVYQNNTLTIYAIVN